MLIPSMPIERQEFGVLRVIKIVRVRIGKDQLRRLTTEERAMFLLVGHVANQLAILTKLVAFSSNWGDYGPIVEKVTAGQTQMFARQAIGVANEAWELIHKRFLSRPLGHEYREKLAPTGREALDNLCKYFGSKNVIAAIRNSFAFHNPRDSELEAAFEAVPNEAEWEWYLCDHNINTFYLMSDLVITFGILGTTGIVDPIEAHTKVSDDIKLVSNWIVDFALAFVSAVLETHFPETEGEVVEQVASAPNVFGVKLPFYVEVPDTPSANSRQPT
jgi:hypothetical protein